MFIFACGDSYEELMSAIYECWERALISGHDKVSVIRKRYARNSLIDEVIYTELDEEKALKVTRSVENKISKRAAEWIYRAQLSDDPKAADIVYRFMIDGFKYGSRVIDMLTLPSVMDMMQLVRYVGGEAHHFIEFARFNRVGKAYIAHLSPKSDVIGMVAEHFADRMPSEHFMIIDDDRKKAAVHPADEEVYIRLMDEKETELLMTTESYEDEYTSMWRTFFDTIAIKERINPRCQLNHFPKWKRKHATEFMKGI